MSPTLRFGRIVTLLAGVLQLMLGLLLLVLYFGTPANDPAGAPGAADGALGFALAGVALVLVLMALRTRRAGLAWLCAGIIAVTLVACLLILFV